MSDFNGSREAERIMKETIIPGIKAQHSIISDKCRSTHGNPGAFHEAVKRLEEIYYKTCEGWTIGKGAKINIVMTVERN